MSTVRTMSTAAVRDAGGAPVTTIDLNADAGEGFGLWQMSDDAALMGIVSSLNVACGFHAGDPSIMRSLCRAAGAAGVAVGAHVSYPDLIGFGRRRLDIDPAELADLVLYQVAAIDGVAKAEGVRLAHVKPHGGLYNAIVREEAQARAVVEGVAAFDRSLPIIGLPGSSVLTLAERAGVPVIAEAFADRAYTAEGELVHRREAGSVLHDPERIAERVVRLVTQGRVRSTDGTDVEVNAASVCVHGDTPGAVQIARRVRAALEDAGVAIASAGRSAP